MAGSKQSGGVGNFFLGIFMLIGGGYMLLQSIRVSSGFSMGMGLFRLNFGGAGAYSVTTGMVLIPMIFGIGLLFYNSKKILGWLLTFGSLIALIFGVLSNLRVYMRNMSIFELTVMLVLTFGGLGLFLRSLKQMESDED